MLNPAPSMEVTGQSEIRMSASDKAHPKRVVLRLKLDMEPKTFEISELFISRMGYQLDGINPHYIHYEVPERSKFHIVIDLNSATNPEVKPEDLVHEGYRVIENGSDM